MSTIDFMSYFSFFFFKCLAGIMLMQLWEFDMGSFVGLGGVVAPGRSPAMSSMLVARFTMNASKRKVTLIVLALFFLFFFFSFFFYK